jgi:hypothetical protein
MNRKQYQEYARRITNLLGSEEFYNAYKANVESGSSVVKLQRKRLVQDISIDWIDFIEDCLPSLDTIVRNPRKFIVQEEDIVDISLARSITTESVKHLAQHTNMISKVDKDGMVTPNKILNVSKEESYEIYENRFIYTLLNKLNLFITMRFDKIKEVCAMQNVLQLDVESRFKIATKKMSYRMECIAQMPMEEVLAIKSDESTKIERIAKMDRIVKGFLSSAFAKQMKNSSPVRPPITRTNVILKNPDFKRALSLWQFIETYETKQGYSVTDEIENCEVQDEATRQLRNMVALSTLIFESMYEHDTDEAEDDQFGFMEFGESKVPVDASEEGTPIDTEEAEIEEQQKTPDEQAEEHEVPAEYPVPEEQAEEEAEEQAAEEEEEEIEAEKSEEELEREVEEEEKEEAEVEVEPEDEEEEETDEDEEDEFDRNLYDIRTLYRRPEDDKLRQAEIAKIREAIDRCLAVYKNEKKREKIRRQRAEREEQRRIEIERRGKEKEEKKRQEAAKLESRANLFYDILNTSYEVEAGAHKPIIIDTTTPKPKTADKPKTPKKKPVAGTEYTTAAAEAAAATDAPKKRGRPPKAVEPSGPKNIDKEPVRVKEKRKVAAGFGLGMDIRDALGGVSFELTDKKKPDKK